MVGSAFTPVKYNLKYLFFAYLKFYAYRYACCPFFCISPPSFSIVCLLNSLLRSLSRSSECERLFLLIILVNY